MATTIGIGFSAHPVPEQAFKEAAIEVKTKLNLPTIDLALVLFSSGYLQQNAIEPVIRILQPGRLVGSIVPGMIIDNRTETNGVAVLGIASDEIKLGTTLLDHVSLMNARDVGLKAAREAIAEVATPVRHGFLALRNGINANHGPLLMGLQETFGRSFMFFGGVCCDEKLGRSLLFRKNILSSDGFLGILFGGQTHVASAARHGWKPLGKPRIVDEAKGNLIKSIDRKPAVALYQEYFPDDLAGKEPSNLGHIGLLYPLGLGTGRPKEYLLRHPVEVLPDGSIVCQADVAVGSRVHLMISDKDSCRQAAHDAALDIREQLAGRPPKLVIVMESIARKKLLGRAISQELNIIKEILSLTVPIFGMYTYGEIAPLGPSKENRTSEIQNATIVITAIG